MVESCSLIGLETNVLSRISAMASVMTPEISKDQRQNTSASRISYRDDGTVSEERHSDQWSRWSNESRPQSVTNRKGPSGWRQPSGWYHNTIEATPNPPFSAVERDSRRDSRFPVARMWIGGYGWDDTMSRIPAFPSDLISRAEIKALLKLKGQTVNLAQAFAEREQTARLFSDVAVRIAKGVRAYRSGNPKRIWQQIIGSEGRRGAAIPQSWLELQYGWKPLMSDIQGSCDALQQSNADGRAYRASVIGVAKDETPISWSKVHPQTGLSMAVSGKTHHECRVRLDYVMENPLLASLSEVGITNPAHLAWELLPYSFVVDWFIPVGDWISAFDAAVGWSFLGGSRTLFQRLNEEAHGFQKTGVLDPSNPYLSYEQRSDVNYVNRRMSMLRTTYSSSPLPRFPGIQNPLSTGHIANALALLAQSFR